MGLLRVPGLLRRAPMRGLTGALGRVKTPSNLKVLDILVTAKGGANIGGLGSGAAQGKLSSQNPGNPWRIFPDSAALPPDFTQRLAPRPHPLEVFNWSQSLARARTWLNMASEPFLPLAAVMLPILTHHSASIAAILVASAAATLVHGGVLSAAAVPAMPKTPQDDIVANLQMAMDQARELVVENARLVQTGTATAAQLDRAVSDLENVRRDLEELRVQTGGLNDQVKELQLEVAGLNSEVSAQRAIISDQTRSNEQQQARQTAAVDALKIALDGKNLGRLLTVLPDVLPAASPLLAALTSGMDLVRQALVALTGTSIPAHVDVPPVLLEPETPVALSIPGEPETPSVIAEDTVGTGSELAQTWQQTINNTILPAIREMIPELSQADEDDIVAGMSELLPAYTGAIDHIVSAAVQEKDERKILADKIAQATSEVHRILHEKYPKVNLPTRELYLMLQTKFIGFVGVYLAPKYHVTKHVSALRAAAANLSMIATTAETLARGQGLTLNGAVEDVHALMTSVSERLSAVDEGIPAPVDESRVASLVNDMEVLGQSLRSGANVPPQVLRQQVAPLIANVTRKLDTLSNPAAESGPGSQPAAGVTSSAMVIPLATSIVARPALPVHQGLPTTEREELDQLPSHFPPIHTELVRALSDSAKLELNRLFRKDFVLAQRLVDAVYRQRVPATHNNMFIRSVAGAMGMVTIGYLRERLNDDVHNEIGFLHEMVAVRRLIEAGIPISAIGKAFKVEVEYHGWVLSEDKSQILPIRRSDFIEADAYSKTLQAVYEVKWMNTGFNDDKAEILDLLRFRTDPIPMGRYGRSADLIAMRLFNQVRKLGVAVQKGVISGAVEFHITSSRPLNPGVAQFIQETIPNVRIYVYSGLLSSVADATRMPEHPLGRWVPSETAGRRFEWVGLNAVRIDGQTPEPAKTGKMSGKAHSTPDQESGMDSQSVVPMALDDAVVHSIYGPEFFAAHVAEPRLSKRVANRDLAVRTSLANGVIDIKQTLAPLLTGQGFIPSLAQMVREGDKGLVRLKRGIPSEASERGEYLQNLRAVMQTLAVLNLLAAQWRSADSKLEAMSPGLEPEHLSAGIAASLQRVNDGLKALELSTSLDAATRAGEVMKALVDLESQLGRISVSKPLVTVAPAMTLAALLGRNVQDASGKNLGLLPEGDRDIYRELAHDVRLKKMYLPEDMSGLHAYRVAMAEVEARFDALVIEIETLRSKDADDWLGRFSQIETQLLLLWKLNAKLAGLVDVVRIVPQADEGIKSLLGELKLRLRQDDGVSPDVVKAAIGNADFLLASIEQLAMPVDPEATTVRPKAGPAVQEAGVGGDLVDTKTRRALLASNAHELFISDLTRDGTVDFQLASSILDQFVAALSDATIQDLVSDAIMDQVEVDSPMMDGLREELRSRFEAFKASHGALWSPTDVTGGKATQAGTIILGSQYSEKQVENFATKLLRTVGDTKNFSDWSRVSTVEVRNLMVSSVLRVMSDRLKTVDTEPSRQLRKELHTFNIPLTKAAGVPFAIQRKKGPFFGLMRRYMAIIGVSVEHH